MSFSFSVLFKVDSHPVWVRAKEKFEEKVAEVLKRTVKNKLTSELIHSKNSSIKFL